jgi:hypothetical protein
MRCKKPDRENIAETMKLTSFFPIFVLEDNNQILMEEVSKDELQSILAFFKKDKSLGPKEWTMEFFIEFYDILDENLIKVVEEVKSSGKGPKGIKC